MSNECQPCGGEQAKKYLLVETTASQASSCGESTNQENQNCNKKDQTFDSFLNGFIVPLSGNSVNVNVCNGSLYVHGQWIQTVSPVCYFKILSVASNTITLVNQCPQGFEVPENPEAGLAIPAGAFFYVVSEPQCESDEEKVENLNKALGIAEALCVPVMVESDDIEEIQPVGRVNANPANSAFKKCIKRIKGVIFKSGALFLSALKNNINSTEYGLYRKLGINNTSKEVVELPNYGEFTGALDGKQYAVGAFGNESEKIVGPASFFCPVDVLLVENAIPESIPSWTSFVGDLMVLISTNIAEINAIIKHKDHYHALVHLSMVLDELIPSGAIFKIEMNNELVGFLTSYSGASGFGGKKWFNIVMPIKVMANLNQISMKISQIQGTTGYTIKTYYKVSAKGIYA